MSFQEVKYKMLNHDLNTVSGTKKEPFLKTDPKNWNESEKTLKRSTKTYGVYTELSKNLEFSEDGADFLRLAYLYKDIEARVTLEEWRIHPNEDRFYLHSTGTFDFSEYQSTEHYVKIPFKTGGLNPLIESQMNQKFELEREESINGVTLNPLTHDTVALTAREILLVSSLNSNNFDNSKFITEYYSLNGTVYPYENGSYAPDKIPPLNVIANSDQINIQSVVSPEETFYYADPYAFPTAFFYNLSDVAKTITIRVKYDFEYDGSAGTTNPTFEPRIFIMRYNGAGYDYVEFINVINPAGTYFPERRFAGDVNIDVDLEVLDSLALVVRIQANTGGTVNSSYRYIYHQMEVGVTEESIREDSNTKAVLMHETGDRLMQIITGEQNKFYSEFYGRTDLGYASTEKYALTALALGFWIRKFNDEKLEISIKQYLEASNAIHNTGYTIEETNGSEKIVVEDMMYFFQDFVGIVLTEQVSEVKRKAASDLHYATMEFGYKKPDEDNLYEEAMGLDEYNTKTGYTNPITRVDDKYEKVAEFRADSYGKEFARRKPKLNYPEEDTRYDKDAFVLDLKEGLGSAYEERVWQDDYEVEPTGVFSPNTATGLRLTPFRNSERHQWFFGSGLKKFQNDYVRFANSVGNSELITKKANEDARAENGDVKISELAYPRFCNEWIEFSFPVDFYVNEKIYGTTNVNGREIPNFFGKVEFINEFGQKEYGYLFELKPNNEGKWKLLKAI